MSPKVYLVVGVVLAILATVMFLEPWSSWKNFLLFAVTVLLAEAVLGRYRRGKFWWQ